MKKNTEQKAKRKELIELFINDPDEAAEQLRKYAKELKKTKSTAERVKILSTLLCLHEATIYREFTNG